MWIYCGLIASLMLGTLEERVIWDLDHIGYPEEWVKEESGCLHVAIIGAGMAGIAAAYGLFRTGIHNIALFDAASIGEEGPWVTYAQMKTLRTPKGASGPSLFTASLTFQAWYEAKYGLAAWHTLEKATPKEWADYLYWLRTVLKLPVVNNCRLIEIVPRAHDFELKFEDQRSVFAKKVVLATGRKENEVLPCMKEISPNLYAHTSELRDYSCFKDKDIVIIGAGTSAFDSAGASLEAQAKTVNLLFRRKEIPKSNKLDALAHVGMELGFHHLSDEWRYTIMHHIEQCGVSPPPEAIARVKEHPSFHLNPETSIEKIESVDNKLKISTNQKTFLADFIILATGYKPEIPPFNILLWKDKMSIDDALGNFPYLGSHFQFLEKEPRIAPFLKHIYCFNYAALVSHGLVSSSIDALSVGAERLAEGIAADFFSEHIDQFFEDLVNFQ